MQENLKVLFISAGDYKYGAPKSMFELMLKLKSNHGIIPVMLTKKHNPMNDECERLGIENYSFWSRDIMAGSAYKNPLLNAMKHCVKYLLYIWGGLTKSGVKKAGIDFSEIDIIHTNLNRNDIGAYIAAEYNIPHIWHIREQDYKIKMYKPHVFDYMNHNSDCFIAISNTVKDVWVNRGIDENKVKVVYNGLDTTSFIPRQIRNDNIIKIVMTGRIQPSKGQDQLIRAVGLLPDEIKSKIRIDLYGDAYSDYENYIRKEMEKGGTGSTVNFCGYCDNVPSTLSEYDIGVVCSTVEGFGRVTAEYMLAGLLVIASDTGANPELINNNENGMLYTYGDVNNLSDIIKYVINNPRLIDQYGQKARSAALENFNIDRCADEIYHIYQQVCSPDFRNTKMNKRKE